MALLGIADAEESLVAADGATELPPLPPPPDVNTAPSDPSAASRLSKQVGRTRVTEATAVHPLLLTHRVDRSGWLLKTGRPERWRRHRWVPRFFVLTGGSLHYYQAQELDQPRGSLELPGDAALWSGVSLAGSAPEGSFTLSLAGAGRVDLKLEYPLQAGGPEEAAAWMEALRRAAGAEARPAPPRDALEQLVAFSGSVNASGGTPLAVRIQKRLAHGRASEADLVGLLAPVAGALLMLRGMCAAHSHAVGAEATSALQRSCYTLAAKVNVLLRCGRVSAASLERASAALRAVAASVLAKDARVRPAGGAARLRLLPGAVTTDPLDPFHTELGGKLRGVGNALVRALAAHVSDDSIQRLHAVFGSLASAGALASLFGEPLRPVEGVACARALQQVLDGARAAVASDEVSVVDSRAPREGCVRDE